MNWHVLVIMQSFISHRFLFIGNFGKSLKNWPSHLTTTGFFSTWLGVGDKYFHIFMHWWLVFNCWKRWRRRRQRTVAQPHAKRVLLLPPSVRDQAAEIRRETDLGDWERQSLVRAWCDGCWGDWGERFLLQRVFPALGWMQIPLACSEQLSSSRSLAKGVICFLAVIVYFWQQFSFTAGLRKTRPWSALLFLNFFCSFFFFFFFLNRLCSLQSSKQLFAASKRPCCSKMCRQRTCPSPGCLAPGRAWPTPVSSRAYHVPGTLLLLKHLWPEQLPRRCGGCSPLSAPFPAPLPFPGLLCWRWQHLPKEWGTYLLHFLIAHARQQLHLVSASSN